MEQFSELMEILKEIRDNTKPTKPKFFDVSIFSPQEKAKITLSLFQSQFFDLHRVSGVGRSTYNNIMEKLESVSQSS